MEIDRSEAIESEGKPKENQERTLRSSTERIRQSIGVAQWKPTISKFTPSRVYENKEGIQQQNDDVVLLSGPQLKTVESDPQSVYNFDQYSVSSCITKRSRGRPRKDGRTSVHSQHRKLFRGRGRPKREDCGSSSVQQPKIFPGRPRARTRKMHRQLFPRPSDIIKQGQSITKEDEATCHLKEPEVSGDISFENAADASEVSSTKQVDAWLKTHCSLCNLSDNNYLGLGRLEIFKPNVELSPEKAFDVSEENLSEVPEKQKEQGKVPLRKCRSPKTLQECPKLHHKSSGSQRLSVSQDPFSELSAVGFDNPTDIRNAFQDSGVVYVHFNCALWSEGVTSVQKQLTCVDKAVLNGMFQKCVRCEKYGASVKCCILDCDRLYHYPCAVVSGVLQNSDLLKAACPSHGDVLSDLGVSCVICNALGNPSDLLFCTVCHKYYHCNCLDSSVDVTSTVRAGWQCVECKRCQICRQSGDENKMLVCETCDKGYHTFCMKPSVASVPKGGWKCHNCRLCGDCGARTPGSGPSSRWHLNYTVCDSCYQQRNKGVACPLCGKAYRQFTQRKGMKQCCVCRKYIHAECDSVPDQEANPSEYVCPICVNPVEVDNSGSHYSPELTKGSTAKQDSTAPLSDVCLNNSRDSFTTENENTLSSAESDSTIETNANTKLTVKARAKTAEFRCRKKAPKMKMKDFAKEYVLDDDTLSFMKAFYEPKEYKTEDDDPSAENRMVLASAGDEFVLCQDLCVMCGSFGKGDEGRLIACAQCGQCYHSYCASIKVTPVVLKKGWRCLDCTVCEGCGKPHDEGRLLLCDECDISFHIYCLDPPLVEVPPGNWKCKWCVVCVKCNTKLPGFNCCWQANYTLCGPCASVTVCTVCSENYKENDLIIQCTQCLRWCHGKCDQIIDEENAERCAEFGYICMLCRPTDEPPVHLQPLQSPPTPEPEPIIEKPPSPVPKLKEQDIPIKVRPPIQFYLDGVCLSESGLRHIKSLTVETPRKLPRPRKPRQSIFGIPLTTGSHLSSKFSSIHNFGNLEGFDFHNPMQQDYLPDVKSEPDIRAEISDDFRMASSDYTKDVSMDDLDKKKRPRKIQKLGIGGFVVKPRGRNLLMRESSGDCVESLLDAGQVTAEVSHILGAETSDIHAQEKPKRRRKPKKKRTPLDESFPSYLRDAFFGKDLLMSCKRSLSAWDITSQEDISVDSSGMNRTPLKENMPIASQQQVSASDSVTNSKLLDGVSVSLGSRESVIGSQNILVEEMKPQIRTVSAGDENLLDVLHQSRDSLTPSLTGFPQMDSKDVEDVIEGALRDQAVSQATHIKGKLVGNRATAFLSDTTNSPVSVPQSQQPGSFAVQRSTAQIHTQSSPVHRENTPNLHHQDSNSSWSESESSDQVQMPKSTMKWEADEALGLLSTISPVLYANINCPHLKLEFPNWSDRVKQIAKIWRSLPSEKRQPYLQKARENRSASRTQKANPDFDRTSKESKSQELDQEKQWKQFQALRQLQQQKQQKILQEQRAQALIKAQTDKLENPEAFADIETSLKQGPSHESDSSQKDVAYEKIYEKKWLSDSSVQRTDELTGPHLLQQAQLVQGKTDVPSTCRPSSQGRPLSIGPFMHVTRVHQAIEQSHVPVGDSVPLTESSSMSPVEQYSAAQVILSPRGLPSSHNRMPYSPTSPIPRPSLLISRPELTRVVSPLQKDMLYTPPSTPRPAGTGVFFQCSVPARAQFLPTLDTQQSLAGSKSPGSTFQASTADAGVYSGSSNANQFHSGNVRDVSPSKPFYSAQIPASGSKPISPGQLPVGQTNVAEGKGRGGPVPNLMPAEHFMRQQQPASVEGQNLSKGALQYKDDIFSTMKENSQTSPIPSQEPSQPIENVMKEKPDPNKLMAHHQLKELLQKQQTNKPEEMHLHLRGKEAASLQQWPKGIYNTGLPFTNKDDCFRQPLPPAVRTRHMSAKDNKSDLSSDLLAGSSGLKSSIPQSEEVVKDDKTVLQAGNSSVSVVSPVQACDASQQALGDVAGETVDEESSSVPLGEVKSENGSPSSIESRRESDLSETNESAFHEESQQSSDFVSSESKDVSSPGVGKKRKTTAADLVKDLESQPEEHDAITSNLDVLTGDVGDLELDDDELLGLGNDFNILEYADPELDKGLVGEGEKSNILDEHLDLDDKDELEDEEDEIKSQQSAEEKDLIPAAVVPCDKERLEVKVNSLRKSTETCPKPSDFHEEFLNFEKKEENGSLKSTECKSPKKSVPKEESVKKEETDAAFSSCNISNVTFSPTDELQLKAEVATVKDLQAPPQPLMSFSSPIHNMSSQETAPVFTTQIGSPVYRVAGVVRQNLTSSGPHFQQSTLMSQQRSVFPLHVGVPMRPNIPIMQPSIIQSPTQQSRPLLLQEQPLLLEDLVEQEKREQMRQTQEGLISPHGDALLSDIDFERLKDDVFSGPPDDSLGGPGSLLSSHEPLKQVISPSVPTSSVPTHNFVPPPYSLIWQNQEQNVPSSGPSRSHAIMQAVQPRRAPVPNVIGSIGLPHGILLHGEPPVRAVQSHKSATIVGNASAPFMPSFLPAPPSPPVMDPHTEQEKQKILQYEKFLVQQQTFLSNQQKYFETEVIKLRKAKKALNAKQRQLRKNGSELSKSDADELARISHEQAGLQKQLEQVRKQSKQHSITLEDYRIKQHKRQQQQQQQQISQSPVHASVGSLQSSPQSSHSPHQVSQGAPPSPMLPSSPVGPSPTCIQHSPSPLTQHSPAAASPSAVVQQSSSLVHSHIMPQQAHFQMARSEGKSWCSNAMQISQISENAQPCDKVMMKEAPDNANANVKAGNSPVYTDEKSDQKSVEENKPKVELESNMKSLSENSEAASVVPKNDVQSDILKTEKTAETCSIIADASVEEETSVAKSILSQSLPSSVTNTLNFTLRQTGMPTVCLPTADTAPSEVSTQIECRGLSPVEKTHSTVEPYIADVKVPKIEPIEDSKLSTEPMNSTEVEESGSSNSIPVPSGELTISSQSQKQTELSSPDVATQSCKQNDFSIAKESEEKTENADGSIISRVDKEEGAHEEDIGPSDKSETSCSDGSRTDSNPPSSLQESTATLPSSSQVESPESAVCYKSDNLECKDTESMLSEGHVLITDIKKEVSYDDNKSQNANACSQYEKNASSDEELENLSKTASVTESEQDQGKQNVLLKQLLQNCPSAETSHKPETAHKSETLHKPDTLVEIKKEAVKQEETSFDSSNEPCSKRMEDLKLKKPSYLDIRRAQLEKEPTPPPGENKPKAPKRKRPKKKKPDGKDGSPVKKKCQKTSLSKPDDGYGTHLESIMTQLTNLPPLRILEPNIKPNFNILPVAGAGDLNAKENQLRGTYGNAVLPNQVDVYSYYPYAKDHATPVLSLPPSPPYRGFYSQEFPAISKGKSEAPVFTRSQLVESERNFRDVDSPDTVISSSSPECCMFEPLCKWPELIFNDSSEPKVEQKSYSPIIPIIAPIPVRLTPYGSSELACYFDKEKDKENIPRLESMSDISLLKSKMGGLNNYATPLKDSGNVSVTLTLSAQAAEDICEVLSRLADLLKIPIPSTYEIVERTATPPSQKLGLYRKSKNSEVNIQSLLNGKPRFCRHCDIVVLSAGIRKKTSELACMSKEEQGEEDEVTFCSTNCYMQFALTHRSPSSEGEDKEIADVIPHSRDKQSNENSTENRPSDDEDLSAEDSTILIDEERKGDGNLLSDHSKPGLDASDENTVIDGISMEIADTDINNDQSTEAKAESNNESTAFSFSVHKESQDNKKEDIMDIEPKSWKSLKYKYWTACTTLQTFKSVKDDQAEKAMKPFYHTIKPSQMPKDGRRCIFCHVIGDGDTNGSGRLLNMDVDKWVHLNCALWSAEVYETVNGALMNVETAYKRAAALLCCSCNTPGSSLKCFKARCSNIYHFMCAMKENCVFFKDKTLMCAHHAHKGTSENELESVAVYRRVYIDRDEHRQVASMIQGEQYVMRIGSLIFLNIGQLLPQQMQAFHTPNCIYPVGFKVIRMYWSMRKLGRRCQYICNIGEVRGKPEFNIYVKEAEHKDIILKDRTAKGLWQKVLYPIEKMRRQAKTIKIFPDFITGDDLFGLTEPAVLRIIESLPGVDTLLDYNFRYGRSPFLELPLAINPTGCARSEPKLRTHVKRSHTLHTSNSPRTSFHPAFGGNEITSPYIKQFVHSKSSQYRKMKIEWRNNVYLARSRIQGLGLYAARDLEKHTMVIEYIGQLIRNEIAERNEAIYDAQNRGVYMFRLDENRVIDATLCGGLARYMNHSCNPNCVAEVVQIDRENKILITTNRRISRGEELSYDYKFEVEDDQHKIPCLCKGANCRKWMN